MERTHSLVQHIVTELELRRRRKSRDSARPKLDVTVTSSFTFLKVLQLFCVVHTNMYNTDNVIKPIGEFIEYHSLSISHCFSDEMLSVAGLTYTKVIQYLVPTVLCIIQWWKKQLTQIICVKVKLTQCRYTLLQIKALHLEWCPPKSTKVLVLKY